jgi:hypothetical protein
VALWKGTTGTAERTDLDLVATTELMDGSPDDATTYESYTQEDPRLYAFFDLGPSHAGVTRVRVTGRRSPAFVGNYQVRSGDVGAWNLFGAGEDPAVEDVFVTLEFTDATEDDRYWEIKLDAGSNGGVPVTLDLSDVRFYDAADNLIPEYVPDPVAAPVLDSAVGSLVLNVPRVTVTGH